MELQTTLEGVLGLAVFVNAQVFSGHSDHTGVALVVDNIRDTDSRVQLDAQLLSLLAKPSHNRAQRPNVVLALVSQPWSQWQGNRPGLCQQLELVSHHGVQHHPILRLVAQAFLLEVREEFEHGAWLKNHTGQGMRTDITGFLKHNHTVLVLSVQLLELNSRRESRWTGTHDTQVDEVFHPRSCRNAAHVASQDA